MHSFIIISNNNCEVKSKASLHVFTWCLTLWWRNKKIWPKTRISSYGIWWHAFICRLVYFSFGKISFALNVFPHIVIVNVYALQISLFSLLASSTTDPAFLHHSKQKCTDPNRLVTSSKLSSRHWRTSAWHWRTSASSKSRLLWLFLLKSSVLCFCYVELQMVLLTPCSKVSHDYAVLRYLTLADTSNYNRVIRKLPKMGGHSVVVKVCYKLSKEKENQHSPPVSTSHSLGHRFVAIASAILNRIRLMLVLNRIWLVSTSLTKMRCASVGIFTIHTEMKWQMAQHLFVEVYHGMNKWDYGEPCWFSLGWKILY